MTNEEGENIQEAIALKSKVIKRTRSEIEKIEELDVDVLDFEQMKILNCFSTLEESKKVASELYIISHRRRQNRDIK